jgi:endonuclease YncB( thermonuclease family)
VEVRKQATDRYRRTVGAVFLDGKDIGLEMISGGCAWHYKQYQKEQTAENGKAYADAENAARSSRLGLWRNASATPPWDYRQEKRK